MSARKRKALRLSPSTHLIEALRSAGHKHALPPQYGHKKDLSHASARHMSSGQLLRRTSNNSPLVDSSTELSLQSILGSYIRRANAGQGARYEDDSTSAPAETSTVPGSGLLRATSAILPEHEVAYLKNKGHDIGDVSRWASIVTARDSYNAAQMLLRSSPEQASTLIQQGKPYLLSAPSQLSRSSWQPSVAELARHRRLIGERLSAPVDT